MSRRVHSADEVCDAIPKAAAAEGIQSDAEATVASYAEHQDRMTDWNCSVDGVMTGLSSATHYETAELTGRTREIPEAVEKNRPRGRRRKSSAGKRGGRRHRSGLNRLQQYRRDGQDQDSDEFAGVIGFGRHLRLTAGRKYQYLKALLNQHSTAQKKRKP